MDQQPDQTPRCASCNAKLKGRYCHKCGEKALIPERDFALGAYLRQAFAHFTHLDSKVLRSFWLLFSRPGFLSAEFAAGRRMPYMKPLPLFGLAAVVFYVLLPTTTAYWIRLDQLQAAFETHNVLGNLFQVDVLEILALKAQVQGKPVETIAEIVNSHAASASKTWLFALIPFIALVSWGLSRHKHPYYVPQLIFALHSFTGFLLIDLVFLLVEKHLFHRTGLVNADFYPLLLISWSFLALSFRNFTDAPWWKAALSGLLLLVAIILFLLIYRQLITVFILWR